MGIAGRLDLSPFVQSEDAWEIDEAEEVRGDDEDSTQSQKLHDRLFGRSPFFIHSLLHYGKDSKHITGVGEAAPPAARSKDRKPRTVAHEHLLNCEARTVRQRRLPRKLQRVLD